MTPSCSSNKHNHTADSSPSPFFLLHLHVAIHALCSANDIHRLCSERVELVRRLKPKRVEAIAPFDSEPHHQRELRGCRMRGGGLQNTLVLLRSRLRQVRSVVQLQTSSNALRGPPDRRPSIEIERDGTGHEDLPVQGPGAGVVAEEVRGGSMV